MSSVKPFAVPSSLKFVPRSVVAKRLQSLSSGVASAKPAVHAHVTIPMSGVASSPAAALTVVHVPNGDDARPVIESHNGSCVVPRVAAPELSVDENACESCQDNRPAKKSRSEDSGDESAPPDAASCTNGNDTSLLAPALEPDETVLASEGTATSTSSESGSDSPAQASAPVGCPSIPELDDMFETEVGVSVDVSMPPVPLPPSVNGASQPTTAVVDECDDADGYYRVTIGETLGGRYRITEVVGKGMFSGVLRAVDTATPGTPRVAIKVIRANDMMSRAADREIALLQTLAAGDPDNRKRCVRLLGHFVHRKHACLVFESLEFDLRKLTRSVGAGCGLSMAAVRSFGKQLFVALRHLHANKHVHADVKPDNVLIGGEKRNLLKLCDFGTAIPFHELGEYKESGYIQSRYYRAPEVPLGLARTPAMDIWSVGCVLFEAFTGAFAFAGPNNLELLRSMSSSLGAIPPRLARASPFRDSFFMPDRDVLLPPVVNDDGSTPALSSTAADIKTRLTAAAIKGKVRAVKAKHPRNTAKIEAARVLTPQEAKEVGQLADLLNKVFVYDPTKRLSAEQALHHEFFAEANRPAGVVSKV